MTTNSEYHKALKRERDREYRWRESAQGKFESSFKHVDDFENCASNISDDPDDGDNPRDGWLSDHGESVERMLDHLEGKDTLSYYNRKMKMAMQRVRRNCPECLPVLKLINKNGKNREESICCLAVYLMKNGKLPGNSTTNEYSK